MSLAGAAAAMGIPESLVERSAAARSAQTGASVDEILTAWAGGEAAAADQAARAKRVDAVEEVVEETPVVEEAAPTPAAIVVEPAPVAAGVTTRAPTPDEVTASQASHLPEVITVSTAGIKERTNFVIPRWLTAVMLIVPLFALFALGGSATGECGEATELATDVVTGQIVNCDGTEFEGAGPGGGGTDYFALGADIYNGVAIAGVNCSGCHGPNGQGTAAFPSLSGVLTTFGACTEHVEWVTLGSAGFTAQGAYGDTNKPVNGGMPSFAGSLTGEQIAAVSAFQRVRFGGADPDQTLIGCNLAVSPEEGGEDEEGGEVSLPHQARTVSVLS